jgi:CDP-glycerol glycerophosphotransferase (TagB/SpsB family)
MRYLPELTIVSKNRKVQSDLFQKGVYSILYPSYPKVVIMARHSFHMFPSSNILKIGLRHGAYHFKQFIDKSKYNRFDLYLFTSDKELEEAQKLGIKNGIAVGFPKIDDLHNGNLNENEIKKLKKSLSFVHDKTLLFTATWNKSGMSAVDLWYDKLKILSNDYNILVTLHPFTESKYVEKLKNEKYLYFIENENVNPFLKIADLLIGDTSSIIGEFCSLDKPIITFKISTQSRMNPEVMSALDSISFRVSDFEELRRTLPVAFEKPDIHSKERLKFNSLIFSELDGRAGQRAANSITDFLEKRGISF